MKSVRDRVDPTGAWGPYIFCEQFDIHHEAEWIMRKKIFNELDAFIDKTLVRPHINENHKR